MTPSPPPPVDPLRRRRWPAFAALLAAAAGLGAVYGIGAGQRNAPPPGQCAAAVATAQRIAPLARGEVAAFQVAERPLAVPELVMHEADGRERRLSQWRGRSLLLNLWATWCIPCRQEMPALDAVEAKLGSPDFQVVAINIDTRDTDKPRAWLRDAGIARLGYFADSTAQVFQSLKIVGRAIGMPTTMLVDPEGCEIGTMAGPAAWASEDGVRLVEAALRR